MTRQAPYLEKVIPREKVRVDVVHRVGRGGALGDVQEAAFSDVVTILETRVGDAAVRGSDLHFAVLDDEHVLSHLVRAGKHEQ